MKLKCENIGKLVAADIDLKAITVIAGLNSTGKSTIGKMLYCIFNSFYNFENEAQEALKGALRSSFFDIAFPLPNIDSCIDELYSNRFSKDKEQIKNIIINYAGEHSLTKKNLLILDRIMDLLNLSDDDIYKSLLQAKFYSEFSNQIQNVFKPNKKSTVSLTIKDSTINVEIKNNKIYSIKNFQTLKTEVIYIDDPFVLDTLVPHARYNLYTENHKTSLQQKLVNGMIQGSDIDTAIQELLTTKKINNVYEKLDAVCKGNIISDSKNGFSFKYENSNEVLNFVNLSTGLKTFAIVKTLLLNGSLVNNGTIILDEPEIHLHPEWQKVFAEVIVLLQKEFGMHILINSHSPYFINAIDVYAQKYEIRKACKFYLAKDEDEYTSKIIDVSDNLEPINKLLFIPLQNLENERAEITAKE